tara:strand:+ start:2497 stop:2853 length:357 start_codon:yes stop_codon:yes gene_type:complete
MIKVIIAGGRDFNDAKLLERSFLDNFNKYRNHEVQIVSGTAKGADAMGEALAAMYNLDVVKFPALWHVYGRSAGYKRNVQMAENATHLLAFWDGKSKGTEHMINIANRMELKVRVIQY